MTHPLTGFRTKYDLMLQEKWCPSCKDPRQRYYERYGTTTTPETFERGGQVLTTGDGACCGTPGSPPDQKGQCYDANSGDESITSKEECMSMYRDTPGAGPLCGSLNKWDTRFSKCPGQCSCMGATPPDCTCTGGEYTYATCAKCGGSWFGAPAGATKTQEGVCWGPQDGPSGYAPPFCFDRTTSPAITTKEACQKAPELLGCGTWVAGRLCTDNTGGEPPCL